MLPGKIYFFLDDLLKKNKSEELVWEYNDNESIVKLENNNFCLEIKYFFDTIEEVGAFKINYLDKTKHKDYFFSTNESYNDYETVKELFDYAQASELQINFEI